MILSPSVIALIIYTTQGYKVKHIQCKSYSWTGICKLKSNPQFSIFENQRCRSQAFNSGRCSLCSGLRITNRKKVHNSSEKDLTSFSNILTVFLIEETKLSTVQGCYSRKTTSAQHLWRYTRSYRIYGNLKFLKFKLFKIRLVRYGLKVERIKF